jgi:hypothetical protein
VAAGVAVVVAAVGFVPANWTKFPFKLITEIRSTNYFITMEVWNLHLSYSCSSSHQFNPYY